MSSFYANGNNINGVSEEAKEFIKEFSGSDSVFLNEFMEPEGFNGFDEEPEFSNMLEGRITVKAKEVMDTLSGECVFVHENYSWGDCDEYGPTEHMWTLYVVMKDADSCKYYRFYREVFEMHGQKDEEIDYEEDGVSEQEKKRMPVF
jgi:hypothetical protein